MKTECLAAALYALLLGLFQLADGRFLGSRAAHSEAADRTFIRHAPLASGEVGVFDAPFDAKTWLGVLQHEAGFESVFVEEDQAGADIQRLSVPGKTNLRLPVTHRADAVPLKRKDFHESRNALGWRLATVFHSNPNPELDVIGERAHLYVNTLNRDVGTQLAVAGIREALVGRPRRIQGARDIHNPNQRNGDSRARENRNKQRPLSHILLGVQIVLGGVVGAFGLWGLNDAGKRARAGDGDADGLYALWCIGCAVLGGLLALLSVLAIVGR